LNALYLGYKLILFKCFEEIKGTLLSAESKVSRDVEKIVIYSGKQIEINEVCSSAYKGCTSKSFEDTRWNWDRRLDVLKIMLGF